MSSYLSLGERTLQEWICLNELKDMWHDAPDWDLKEQIDGIISYMTSLDEYQQWCLEAIVGEEDDTESTYTRYKSYYLKPSICGGIDIHRKPGVAPVKNVTDVQGAQEWIDDY